MPTSWVTGRLKDSDGNVASPETLASKVYLDNGQTVDNKLTSMNSAQSDIINRLTSLRLAADSLATAINGNSSNS